VGKGCQKARKKRWGGGGGIGKRKTIPSCLAKGVGPREGCADGQTECCIEGGKARSRPEENQGREKKQEGSRILGAWGCNYHEGGKNVTPETTERGKRINDWGQTSQNHGGKGFQRKGWGKNIKAEGKRGKKGTRRTFELGEKNEEPTDGPGA